MAIRKIPQRKCIGCNTSKDKKELIRVVRNAEGEISIDMTGKKPGRGAYICNDIKCLKAAIKGKKLEKYSPAELYKNNLSMLPQDPQSLFVKHGKTIQSIFRTS